MRKYNTKRLWASFIFLFAGAFAHASDQRYLTYSGRIVNAASQAVTGNVSFHIQITDTTGTCILWDESFASVPVNAGVFTLEVGGSGTVNFNGGSGVLDTIFLGGVALNCSGGGTVTPSVTDDRNLSVTFNDGTGSGNQTFANQIPIKSVPFAMSAESVSKIDGYAFSSTPPAAGQVLELQSGVWTPVTLGGGTGTVTTISASGGLTTGGSPITNSGTISLAPIAANSVLANASGSSAVPSATTVSALIDGSISSTVGSLLYRGSSGWTALSPSTNGYFLQTQGAGNAPQWAAAPVSGMTALTGDVVASGSGSVVATIQSGAVTPAKMSFAGSMGVNTGLVVENGTQFFNMACSGNQVLLWTIANGWICSDVSSLTAGTATNFSGSLSGDVTGTQGATVVSLIQGKAISPAAYASGQVLRYNGSAWINQVVSFSDLAGIPSTLSGYGITDAVKNLGGSPGIQTGADSSKPGAPTAGTIYFATDTNKIWQYNSGAWVVIASAGGSGGTITAVNVSGAGLTGGGSSGSVSLALSTELQGLSALSSNGYVKRTGAGTYTSESSISLTSDVGSSVLPVANGGTNSSTALNNNRVMVSSGSAIVESAALTDGELIIGSSAGAPVPASITGSGGITVTPGHNSINISASGITPTGSSLSSANIWVGNASNQAAAVSVSGDVSLTNAGATKVNSINGTTVAGVGLANNDLLQNTSGTTWTSNNLLYTNSTGVTTLTTPASGVLTSSGTTPAWSTTLPFSMGGTGASSFSSGHIVIAGTTSLAADTCTTSGQILEYNGSSWVCTASTGLVPTAYTSSGNAFGATSKLGSTDNHTVNLIANGSNVAALDKAGNFDVYQNLALQNGAGIQAISGGGINGNLPIQANQLTYQTEDNNTVMLTLGDGIDATIQGYGGTNGTNVNLLGGTPTGGNGGNVVITGANATGTNKNGGNIVVTAGTATGTGTAGTVQLMGGNVGVGVAAPQVALDVYGAVRAGSSTAVTTCGSGQSAGEGSQRYNYTSHSMEYCNGTGWVALSSPNSQTLQDVTASRAFGTTYTNSTSNPITVLVGFYSGGTGNSTLTCNVNGITLPTTSITAPNSAYGGQQTFVVPAGNTYACIGGGGAGSLLNAWVELR
jgi:hypothetical protein